MLYEVITKHQHVDLLPEGRVQFPLSIAYNEHPLDTEPYLPPGYHLTKRMDGRRIGINNEQHPLLAEAANLNEEQQQPQAECQHELNKKSDHDDASWQTDRITSYNVCYTKLLRYTYWKFEPSAHFRNAAIPVLAVPEQEAAAPTTQNETGQTDPSPQNPTPIV